MFQVSRVLVVESVSLGSLLKRLWKVWRQPVGLWLYWRQWRCLGESAQQPLKSLVSPTVAGDLCCHAVPTAQPPLRAPLSLAHLGGKAQKSGDFRDSVAHISGTDGTCVQS